MHKTLEKTLNTIDLTVPVGKFLTGLSKLMRNPYWNHRGLGPEARLQMLVFMYLDTVYPDIIAFHVPNGAKRSKWEQFIAKYTGVKKGVSDILIPHRRANTNGEIYCGLVIELKVGAPITPEQTQFLAKMMAQNWVVSVETTFEQAKQTIDNYLNK